ncbi:MAG: nucleotidyltransferase substrate binding protein [Saprospiraceae bacterium]|nr:nucleotidyltransferase substrate binding protein [Saprospiraceae bacterium]
MEQDIRWLQRFQNFSRAIGLLKEIKILKLENLSLLEKEGIIQRFEFTLEPAWKTLKDRMEFDGLITDKISPKMVAREAYKTKYIDNIDSWMRMIGDRNLLSHIYDFSLFETIIPSIQNEYVNTLEDLYTNLKEKQE